LFQPECRTFVSSAFSVGIFFLCFDNFFLFEVLYELFAVDFALFFQAGVFFGSTNF